MPDPDEAAPTSAVRHQLPTAAGVQESTSAHIRQRLPLSSRPAAADPPPPAFPKSILDLASMVTRAPSHGTHLSALHQHRLQAKPRSEILGQKSSSTIFRPASSQASTLDHAPITHQWLDLAMPASAFHLPAACPNGHHPKQQTHLQVQAARTHQAASITFIFAADRKNNLSDPWQIYIGKHRAAEPTDDIAYQIPVPPYDRPSSIPKGNLQSLHHQRGQNSSPNHVD
ncbi:hypothetical protein ACLOJK_024210 [Asimina triloba]